MLNVGLRCSFYLHTTLLFLHKLRRPICKNYPNLANMPTGKTVITCIYSSKHVCQMFKEYYTSHIM